MTSHREIFNMAWPYTLSMATGFIVQAVDSAMVAPMGTTPLAALGVAVVSCFVPVSFTMGLITSVQKRVVLAADPDQRCRALSGNLILGLLLSLPLVAVYFLFAHGIASLYTSGETVGLAASFIRVFCPSFVFSSMNQALNGFWVGALKSRTRLSITLSMTSVNVVGNLLLSPVLGLKGVALASCIAIVFGFALNLFLAVKFEGYHWCRPKLFDLIADLKVIFGVTLHQISLALTLNVSVAIVGMMGVEALAVANVVATLSLPALYLGIGYGVATGSYIVRSLTENDNRGARGVAAMAFQQVGVISLGLGVLILIFSEQIRHWFFKDPAVFGLARIPIMLLAALFVIDGVGCVLQRFHFVSDGIKKSFLIMTFVQWGLFIPGAFAAVKWGGIGYAGYLGLHLAQRLLIGILLYYAWLLRVPVPRRVKVRWPSHRVESDVKSSSNKL